MSPVPRCCGLLTELLCVQVQQSRPDPGLVSTELCSSRGRTRTRRHRCRGAWQNREAKAGGGVGVLWEARKAGQRTERGQLQSESHHVCTRPGGRTVPGSLGPSEALVL